MTNSNPLPMNPYIAILISVLSSATAQILFKKGSQSLTNLAPDWHFVVSILGNPYLMGGLFLYGASVLVWFFVLTKVELSVAYMFNALTFVIVLVGGYLFFSESLSVYKIAGIACIVLGLFFISRA